MSGVGTAQNLSWQLCAALYACLAEHELDCSFPCFLQLAAAAASAASAASAAFSSAALSLGRLARATAARSSSCSAASDAASGRR